MAMALRPRERPTSMASRCTAQALADGGAAVGGSAGTTPKSVVTPLAGFAPPGSVPIPVTSPTVLAASLVPSASGGPSQEPADLANSAPKSVVTPLAGFAGGGPASAPVAVADGRSATDSLA